MLIVVAKLLLVPSLVQLLPPVDSLERDHVVGTLGARVDARLADFAAYGFSGSVLVARDGEVVLVKGYGLSPTWIAAYRIRPRRGMR